MRKKNFKECDFKEETESKEEEKEAVKKKGEEYFLTDAAT